MVYRLDTSSPSTLMPLHISFRPCPRADLAVRFEIAFGSTADTWLVLQNAYDLAQVRKAGCEIERIERAA